jgi:sugar phosphate isomerase/epimerase
MDLSFTTLGCPEWDLDTIITQARSLGYKGIDFRGYQGENNIWTCTEFSEKAEKTRDIIFEQGLEVPCFSSSIRLLFEQGGKEQNLNEAKEYIKLASLFKTRFIRVFGGYIKQAGIETVEQGAEQATLFLDEIASLAEGTDISFLVETHDDWISGSDLKQVLERSRRKNIGAIWDIHHPFRARNEQPQQTWDLIGQWVRYIHVKDSRTTAEGHQLCLPGTGDIPITETVEVLSKGGYTGYYAFEWEKKWHPEIEEPETAFPAYIEFMNNILL